MNADRTVSAAVRDAVAAAARDKIATMGAAIAFYAAFSLAPMLVIALGLAGVVLGAGGGLRMYGAIGGLLGPAAALTIHDMVQGAASRPRGGAVAAVIGLATLVFGASGVFTQLQDSLNAIWKVEAKPGSGLASMLARRLLSFVMIAVIAVLVPVSLLLGAAIQGAGGMLAGYPGGAALFLALNELAALAITTLLFSFLYRVVPDARVSWRDAFAGGLFTSILFTAGKFVLAAYLGRGGIESVYGAAGSIIAVLLWVYYSSQIVLLGGEFTRAYAFRRGRASAPETDARRENPETPEPAADPVLLYGAGFLFGAAAAVLALLELAALRDRASASAASRGPIRRKQLKQVKARPLGRGVTTADAKPLPVGYGLGPPDGA